MRSFAAPTVSVVVRSIGRPTLERALASIAAQDYPAVEVTLVAASGHDHPPIADRLGAYPIVAVREARRLPRAEAADAGIRAARGEWITFLDDDDELLSGHLAGLTAAAAAQPDARAVNGRALATFQSGRTEIWGQRFALSELYERNFVHLSTLLFHRSLLDAGIGFDRDLPLHEDWDFALQIAQHSTFADGQQATFLWHADAGSSGGGGEANVDEDAFATHRDYVYAKWARVRDPWLERCSAMLQEAAGHAAGGRLAEAAVAARAVLRFSQNDPHALNLLAMLAFRRGDLEEALACQSLAAEVRPHDADLRFNLAQVQLARGDAARARTTLAEVLEIDPVHAKANERLRHLAAQREAQRNAPSSMPRSTRDTSTQSPNGSTPPAMRDEFLDLERRCAIRPADADARRRMLQLFIALGRPDDLPGASLPLPRGTPKPRIAVLTPYFREPLPLLERCHRSVREQTLACDHIVVADGFPRDELDAWPIRHLRLSTPSRDFGDTPRRIAGQAAIDAAYDAVVYLDADNWLRPRHVESLYACHLARGRAVCHSARTLHRVDESVLPLFQQGDNNQHVDTSCLFVAAQAFDLLLLWASWPRELSVLDDRMFWHAVTARGLDAEGFTGALTTCYEATHVAFYRSVGETPPAGVRPDADLGAIVAWHAGLSSAERDDLDRRFGFSVTSFVEGLSGMRR